MAYVGMVCNPGPEWPWPDEKPQPMRARYLAGLYPLEEFAPLLRTPAGQVGMDRADRWIGLSDGGNGLEAVGRTPAMMTLLYCHRHLPPSSARRQTSSTQKPVRLGATSFSSATTSTWVLSRCVSTRWPATR